MRLIINVEEICIWCSKAPLLDELAFPLTGLDSAHVMSGVRSGIMTTARPKCSLTHVVLMPRLGTGLFEGGYNVTVCYK